jgi:large subunit ribosomal protein L29
MRAEELRSMSIEELVEKEAELRETLARLAMKRYARRLDRTSDLKVAKKDLARVLTVLTQTRRTATEGGRDGRA